MAISQTDYLLQEILTNASTGNDHLKAMSELLVEMNKTLKKGSPGPGGGPGGGPGPGPGPRPPNPPDEGKKYSNMFKSMFGSMAGAGSTILGNNGTSANILGSLGTSVIGVSTALGKAIPAIGGVTTAFNMVVEAGMKVYEYMNAQLEMYTQLNSAGLTLATGMSTLERASAKGLMSNAEFGEALRRNSEVLASMDDQYGEGVNHFGQLMNSVQKLQNINGMYGVSQQQLADLTAKNFKYQKLYGSQDSLRSASQAQSTEVFVRQMTTLSKSVGKSVEQLLSTFDGLTTTFDSHANARALERFWGMSEDEAAEVNKAMNGVFSSLGEVGIQLQAANTMKTSNMPLTDEFNNQFTQMLTDRMREIQRAGTKDPKEIQKLLNNFIDSRKESLQLEIDAQYQAGNLPAAKFLQNLRDGMKMMNKKTSDVSPVMEEFTLRFNNWLADTITGPFKTLWADTRDSTLQYLMDTYDAVDSFWAMPAKMIGDLAGYFGIGFGEFGSALLGIPGMLMDTVFNGFGDVNVAFGKLMTDLLQIPGKLASAIWGILTGEGWAASTKDLESSIHGIFSGVGEVFDALGNLTFSYDDMKTKIQSSFESMKSKIGGWWDSAKAWFSGEDPQTAAPISQNNQPAKPPHTSTDKKKAPPKVVEPPSYTKPEKITKEETPADVPNALDPQASSEESILKVLNNLMSATEQTNQINNIASTYLREIAENTSGQQNL